VRPRIEIAEAVAWYVARAHGLGDRFVQELEATVDRIGANAQQYPVQFKDIRRACLRRVPYALFYRIVDDTVHVIACFHGSRDPRRWQGRG
jgi:plasmid stabilization system protein ParE